MKKFNSKISVYQIQLLLLFIAFNFFGGAQNILDPNFPSYIEGEKSVEMEYYSKMHPPLPDPGNFSSEKQYRIKLGEWLYLNPYYPQLIPYHLYKGGLTAEDDMLFYVNAKAAWHNAHPVSLEKYNNR
jgi:hypothetical protein